VLRSVFGIVVAFLLGITSASAAERVTLGRSVILLTGPWRFHTGDDPGWKSSSFDDSSWESVDLTPAPGAHDSDVGLDNYVAGWSGRGHKGYRGFAWYRLKIEAVAPQDESFAIVGPADVDSVYQIYFNGRLIGGDGDFSGTPPSVISIQPHLFALPRADWIDSNGGYGGVLAIRVWCRAAAPPDGGGIHIAPFSGRPKARARNIACNGLRNSTATSSMRQRALHSCCSPSWR
jgi:hypothetical protein